MQAYRILLEFVELAMAQELLTQVWNIFSRCRCDYRKLGWGFWKQCSLYYPQGWSTRLWGKFRNIGFKKKFLVTSGQGSLFTTCSTHFKRLPEWCLSTSSCSCPSCLFVFSKAQASPRTVEKGTWTRRLSVQMELWTLQRRRPLTGPRFSEIFSCASKTNMKVALATGIQQERVWSKYTYQKCFYFHSFNQIGCVMY